MRKRVLDVGNCYMDHAAIRSLVEGRFEAEVVQAHGLDDALTALREGPFALVLVNRKLDHDNSEGLRIVGAVKSDPALKNVAVMMITDHSDHQQRAVDSGAEWGFGKAQLDDPATVERLRPFLG